MSSTRDPVDVVRTLYQLFSNGRLDETFALMAPDVTLSEPGDPALLPWAGRFEGHDGLRRFYEGLGTGLSEIAIDPGSLSVRAVTDEDVLVTGTERGVSRRTSKAYETESAWIWTVQDGHITRLRAFHDTAAMARAMRG